MTSDVGRLNVVASFPDMSRARAAIDSLQFGGFDPLNISLLGEGARDAEHEMNTRKNTTPSDGGISGRLIGRAVFWGLAGMCVGGLFGLVLAFFGLNFVTSLDSYLVQMGSWGLFGLIIGTFSGAMSGISQGDAWELTYSADGDVSQRILVSVHSDDQDQINHAEKLLRGQTPIAIEQFAGESPPRAVRDHINS